MFAVAMLMMVQASAYDADGYTRGFNRCINQGDAANGIQSAMQDCISNEWALQDARLNQTYKLRMASLPAKRKLALRAAQRQWIVIRDRRCAIKDNGQISVYNSVDCKVSATISRIRWLERFR